MALRVIGVMHAPGMEPLVLKQLRELKAKRVGVEILHDEAQFDKRFPDFVFWKNLYEEGTRQGFSFVALDKRHADNPIAQLLSEFGTAKQAGVKPSRFWKACMQQNTVISKKFRKNNSRQTHKKTLALLAELERNLPNPTAAQIDEVCDAITVLKSLDMHERAEKEGVDAGVVGLAHMKHLQYLKHAQPYPVFPEFYTEQAVLGHINAYFKHEKLMLRLKALAS